MRRPSSGEQAREQEIAAARAVGALVDPPVILYIPPVTIADVSDELGIARAMNRLIEAVNQLLPSRTLAISEDGHIVVKRAQPVSAGRDENVPLVPLVPLPSDSENV